MLKKSVSLINNMDYDQLASKHDLDAIEVIANKHKITNKVCSVQSLFYGCNIGTRIVDSVDSYINYMAPIIEDANKVHANLVFGSPTLRICNNFAEIQTLKEFFKEINSICNGAILSIEPNAEIYGGNFLFTTAETIRFIQELQLDNIKLNYDLGTAYFYRENCDFIKHNLDIINHTHISAPYLASIKSVPREYYMKSLEELDKCGYNKYVSLESKSEKQLDEINYFLTLFK